MHVRDSLALKCAAGTLTIFAAVVSVAGSTATQNANLAFSEGCMLSGAWPFLHPLVFGTVTSVGLIPAVYKLSRVERP